MSHDYHPEATEAGVLSVYCDDCNSKRLSDLDDAHLANCTGLTRSEIEALLAPSRALWWSVWRTSALPLQMYHLDRTGQFDKLAAAQTKLPVRP